MEATKPILKWVGGKRQLIKKVLDNIPKDFDNYYEPFLGGATPFLNIPFKHKAFINDFNSDLVETYRQVELFPQKVIDELTIRRNYYNNLDFDTEFSLLKREYFMEQRRIFNISTCPLEKAVLFIFLNKLNFNGIMSYNKKKELNCATGKYLKATIFTEDNLNSFSKRLSKEEITLTNLDYYEAVKEAKKNDFVYLDPPYVPENFSKFSHKYIPGEGAWKEKEFNRLFECFRELDRKGCFVLMSNSGSDFLREGLKEFNFVELTVNRGLVGYKNNRSRKVEVLIKNY